MYDTGRHFIWLQIISKNIVEVIFLKCVLHVFVFLLLHFELRLSVLGELSLRPLWFSKVTTCEFFHLGTRRCDRKVLKNISQTLSESSLFSSVCMPKGANWKISSIWVPVMLFWSLTIVFLPSRREVTRSIPMQKVVI